MRLMGAGGQEYSERRIKSHADKGIVREKKHADKLCRFYFRMKLPSMLIKLPSLSSL